MATGGIGQGSDDAHSRLGRAGDRWVLGFARLPLDEGITGTTCLEGAPGLLEELLGPCAGPLTLRELLLPQEALAPVLRLALLDLRHHGLGIHVYNRDGMTTATDPFDLYPRLDLLQGNAGRRRREVP